ncbi:MAG: hypothetical protein CMJ33_09650, partial [Phycisphaerae bacterium]|nr:hypothetical protein [Phycisphaerae bacterium]
DGGGLVTVGANPAVFEDCTFQDNFAFFNGGGAYNTLGSPTFTGCTFTGNTAEFGGGGMATVLGTTTLEGCRFWCNTPNAFSGSYEGSDNCINEDCTECGSCADWPYDCSLAEQTFYVTIDDGPDALQLALDLAPENWTIAVGPGTYLLDATLDPNGKAVTLRGTIDPVTDTPSSILDGQGVHRVLQCTSGEGADTVFESLVITNGLAQVTEFGTIGTFVSGGGALTKSSSPSFVGCSFVGNEAPDGFGGGILNFESSSTFLNCSFESNTAGFSGGGIYDGFSSTSSTGCTFTQNTAQFGGGVYCQEGTPPDGLETYIDCTFMGNDAEYGGGAFVVDGSETFLDCTFTGNDAAVFGGGINGRSSAFRATGCTFTENTSLYAAAIMNEQGSASEIRDCTFTGNQSADKGGAVSSIFASPTSIIDCTFNGNVSGASGGAAADYLSDATYTNCSFEGNSAVTLGGAMDFEQAYPTVTGCTFEQNDAGEDGGAVCNREGLVGLSPIFDGCTFTSNNAGLDGGAMANFSTATITNTRICDNTLPQIFGAFNDLSGNCITELCTDCAPDCPADLNGDGTVDGADLTLLLGAWGGPDGDLNGDGVTDGADLAILLANWAALCG